MSLKTKVREAFKIWSRSGLAGIRARIAWNKKKAAERAAYDKWLRSNGPVGPQERDEMRKSIAEFPRRPLISVLLPVYNVDEKWLRLCIDSVLGQVYENWELCIADDCSPGKHIRRILDEYVAADARIKVVYRPENGHISAASNTALGLAAGEFAVLLDHDDELSPDALFWVANELNNHPETAMIYSDEDMIDTRGRRSQPKFKPDFSRDLVYSLNLVTHLSAYKTELMRKIGGFRIGFEGSQDYDLALRIVDEISESQIRHIPRVLYHWRAIAGSVALSSDEKPYAHDRARMAIREHLERTGITASVTATHYNLHRVQYRIAEPEPRVSVIIDGPVGEEYLRKLIDATDYCSFEIIVIDPARSISGDELQNVRPVQALAASRAVRLNDAVSETASDVIIFLMAGVLPFPDNAQGSGWMHELVSFASRDEIGAIGGKILDGDQNVFGGGVIIGARDGVAAAHRGFPRDVAGNMGRNQVIGNFSAVSQYCMAVSRDDFRAAGGFDADKFPDGLYAADLCLTLRANGKRVVLTPYAEMVATAILDTKPSAAELEAFQKKWPQYFAADPFYNPNLSKRDGTFSINI